MRNIPLSGTSSLCILLILNLGIYGLVQATVGVGTILIWDFCVAIAREGGGDTEWRFFVLLHVQVQLEVALQSGHVLLHTVDRGIKSPVYENTLSYGAVLLRSKCVHTLCAFACRP